MTVKYCSPWKDDKHGKLKGDKSETWFKFNFDEGIIYPTDNGFVLLAYVTAWYGVVAAYRPEDGADLGACAIPIYKEQYEIRTKDSSGTYKSVNTQPSIFEKALCNEIETNKGKWMPEGKAIGGNIAFSPNAQLMGMDAEMLKSLMLTSCTIETVPVTGKLPEYKVATSNYRKSDYKGYSKTTPQDKLAFLKKELVESISASWATEECCLAVLVEQVISEHNQDSTFLTPYFQLMKGIIS